MRVKSILTFAAAFVLATVVLAQGTGESKAKSAMDMAASRAVVMAASDLKWVDLDPVGAPGIKIVDLWGNHTTGAFGSLIKFPAGFFAPMHTHTSDYNVVVLEGTWINGPEGRPPIRLGPGSYMLQPGEGYRHTTTCDKASNCLIHVESKGKFDLIPVVEGTPPAKK